MSTHEGKLIAFEGIDGAGTTTQISRAVSFLRECGLRVYETAEPSTGFVGRGIRKILQGEEYVSPEALALLFAADRLDHVAKEIQPNLDKGTIVLTDRYLLSSLAYQSMDNPLDWVCALNSRARRPDLNIYFKISPLQAVARVKSRGGPEEIFDAQAKQEHIARCYEEVAKRLDIGAVETINAEKQIDDVTQDIIGLLSLSLGLDHDA